ncbi:MAG: hypothetical protein DRP00_02820 [Candidatus Aenigmatarchaeota archaeon]|nr:MAG: hypothetical protein DRP00_02820 [Candidatus Aenigmarchaeota archaeon]
MPQAKISHPVYRLISPEPEFTKILEAWKPILPRPFRKVWLSWLRDLEATLRAREFWTSMVATEIGAGIYNTIKKTIAEMLSLIGVEIGVLRKTKTRT